MSPCSGGRRRSSRTWAIIPRSLYRKISAPSLTAIPADSWPRCWSAKRPSSAMLAAAVPEPGGRTAPKTPHIRRPSVGRPGAPTPRSAASRARLPAERAGEAAVPGVAQVVEGHVHGVGDARAALLRGAGGAGPGELDDETLAPHGAQELDGQLGGLREAHERRDVVGRDGHDDPAGALAEQVDRR